MAEPAELNVLREPPGSTDQGSQFLSRLADPDAPRISEFRVAVVVAHPDDETIGAGGQLSRFANPLIVHVTDGATRRHAERAAYAKLRQRELESALAMVGIPARSMLKLGIADQEAALQLPKVTARLADIFVRQAIDVVLTHPYEGGHPDHDATAFAVHGAQWLIRERGEPVPAIIEMAFYHQGCAGFVPQEFTPDTGVETVTIPLSTAGWALKQRMLSAHASQKEVVSQFGATFERFRVAPAYDFRAPPNGGSIYYENFDWGMTSERWRQLAEAAMRELGWAPP